MQIKITKADKREKYLTAAICLAEAGYSIVAAEGCDNVDEMPDDEPKEIAEQLWYLLEQVAEKTGLTIEGILMKRIAIIKRETGKL